MTSPLSLLRDHALQIWHAGLQAVHSDRLVRQAVCRQGDFLLVQGCQPIDLRQIERMVVVGAGKASAGMAAGLESALGEHLMQQKQLSGWINIPEGCERPLSHIHLHAARPAGKNEPTPAGLQGSAEILQRMQALGPRDLGLCLISGGGSALLPALAPGVTLADKLAITRHLSISGASIEQLNAVRMELSSIKGGGLLQACGAGRLITLIISDVLGDPLEFIASGPTIPRSTQQKARNLQLAIDILQSFPPEPAGASQRLLKLLTQRQQTVSCLPLPSQSSVQTVKSEHVVIGNNALAVHSAAQAAEQLGYCCEIWPTDRHEGSAETLGRKFAQQAVQLQAASGRDRCILSGGEATVKLPQGSTGLGGRNQQFVLAALAELQRSGSSGIAILSGGTDGEDGPTDAAGALVDDLVLHQAATSKLDPEDYLDRHDAYHFFQPLGALLQTGPTHTNVCDLRVAVVHKAE